jgi:mannosyl-3-phosphoglycerate phosphatase
MRLVFTDLDGSLLDAHTYSFDAARPALDRLRQTRTPLVLVTSKTRAELEVWRSRLANTHPFIVENGGAVFLPTRYFPFRIDGAVERGAYEALELGAPYERLTGALREASRAAACPVAAFHVLEPEEVARRCGLPLEQARLAKAREYDEAFEILDEACAPRLLAALVDAGYRWTRGGRFYHVIGASDKALAVSLLRDLYKRAHPETRTLGLGDAPNDAGFLNVVDDPVIIRSPNAAALQQLVPNGRLTRLEGPAGWNDAVLGWLEPRP